VLPKYTTRIRSDKSKGDDWITAAEGLKMP